MTLFQLNIVDELNSVLDFFINDSSQEAYKILHGISINWGPTVGDTGGLFPIAYLARISYYNEHNDPKYDNSTDLKLCNLITTQIVANWHYTLPDGTFTRGYGWQGQPSGTQFLWSDDQYQGMTPLARLAILNSDNKFANRIGTMQMTYAIRHFDTNDFVYWHGFNAVNNQRSCCKPGRPNGWALMSHVEVLLALKKFPENPYFGPVLSLFQENIAGISQLQSEDGRWHQVLNVSETFLETSCTAMYLWSMIIGVQENWIDKQLYTPKIEKAWNGLLKAIEPDGIVNGIAESTEIGTDISYYQNRRTFFNTSTPGLGSVLKAIAAYERFSNNME